MLHAQFKQHFKRIKRFKNIKKVKSSDHFTLGWGLDDPHQPWLPSCQDLHSVAAAPTLAFTGISLLTHDPVKRCNMVVMRGIHAESFSTTRLDWFQFLTLTTILLKK